LSKTYGHGGKKAYGFDHDHHGHIFASGGGSQYATRSTLKKHSSQSELCRSGRCTHTYHHHAQMTHRREWHRVSCPVYANNAPTVQCNCGMPFSPSKNDGRKTKGSLLTPQNADIQPMSGMSPGKELYRRYNGEQGFQ